MEFACTGLGQYLAIYLGFKMLASEWFGEKEGGEIYSIFLFIEMNPVIIIFCEEIC